MKNLEFDRRVKMQELMILFMQRQEQLWVALPAIQGPCLKGLTEKVSTSEERSDELRTS